jgi:transcriptional regulator with XRE-family HTH domain
MPAFNHVCDLLGNTNVLTPGRTITFVKSLAERLKMARELRQLTQAQLAKRAGCEQSTIGNVESGARQTLRNLVEVARALQVSAEWLYDGNGPAPHNIAAEPLRHYSLPEWPFSHITPEQYRRLSEAQRSRAEGFIEGLIQAGVAGDGQKSRVG